jgi:hypothetical protein
LELYANKTGKVFQESIAGKVNMESLHVIKPLAKSK